MNTIALGNFPLNTWLLILIPLIDNMNSSEMESSALPSSDSRNTFELGGEAPILCRKVFVSSTFRDFHSERDLLQQVVAPRINKACAARGEHFDLVDLRWGVDTSSMNTEEASEKVARTCFDLIDSCEPYFLCFVGERYGWVPGEEAWDRALGPERLKLLREQSEVLGGMSNLSATSAEILYGLSREVLFEKTEQVIGCLRSPISCSDEFDVSGDYFSDGHPRQIKTIQELLEAKCEDRLIRYSATLNKSTGMLESMVTDSGEPLAQSLELAILNAFKEDWEKEDRRGQFDRLWSSNRKFILSRTEGPFILKRDELLQRAKRTIDSRTYPVCVIGEQGEGKTQLLCELYRFYSGMPQTKAIGYFPEASADRLSLSAVFDYLLLSIRISLGLNPVVSGLSRQVKPEEFDPSVWAELIDNTINEYISKSGELVRLLMVIDTSDGPAGLTDAAYKVFSSILPFSSGERSKNNSVLIRTVLSESSWSLARNAGGYAEFTLDKLGKDELINLVELKLKENHRDVTEGMRSAISRIDSGKTPLFALLLAKLLNFLGGEELADLDWSSQIDECISSAILKVPNDTSGLGSMLIDEVCSSLGSDFLRPIIEALAFLPYGATKSMLQSLSETWRSFEFETMLGALFPLISEGADGFIKMTYLPLRESIKASVHARDVGLYEDGIFNLVIAAVYSSDGSIASFGNLFHLCREFNLSNLALALCCPFVGRGDGERILPAANVRSALLNEFVADEGEWFADVIRDAPFCGQITGRIVSFLLWMVGTSPRTRSSDAILCNVGFEAVTAYDSIIERGVDISYLAEERSRAASQVNEAATRSDPDRWNGVVFPSDLPSKKKAVMSREGVMASYIGENYKWGMFRLDKYVAYDLDTLSEWNPRVAEMNLVGFGDAGLAYILSNGYPYKSFKGNSGPDRFITQAAIWWYLADRGYFDMAKTFTEDAVDPYSLRPYIKKIVGEAHAAYEASNGVKPGFSFKNRLPCIFTSESWSSSIMIALLNPIHLVDVKYFKMPTVELPEIFDEDANKTKVIYGVTLQEMRWREKYQNG